jgi:signal transduction histidine kinase
MLVFGNLISNGLKFNHSPRPKVEVTVAEVGPFWEVSVRDNGIGIEPRYRDQIFELFFRLNPRDEFDGSGTGLNLARRIIGRVDFTGAGLTLIVLVRSAPWVSSIS